MEFVFTVNFYICINSVFLMAFLLFWIPWLLVIGLTQNFHDSNIFFSQSCHFSVTPLGRLSEVLSVLNGVFLTLALTSQMQKSPWGGGGASSEFTSISKKMEHNLLPFVILFSLKLQQLIWKCDWRFCIWSSILCLFVIKLEFLLQK